MNKHRIGALIAAGVLTLTFAGTALGVVPVVYATVTGYAAATSDNNHADEWGEDCWKTPDGAQLGSTYLLDADYALVIVKAGAEPSAPGYANTLFANASAGETVWADSNGSGAYDEGDKGISHIIFCGESTTTTTTTTADTTTTTTTADTTTTTTTDATTTTTTTAATTTTTSLETETTDTTTSSVETETTDDTTSSVETETTSSVDETSEAKTPPSTDTIGSGNSGTPGGSLWALLVGAAGVLAGVLLLTPRGSRSRS